MKRIIFSLMMLALSASSFAQTTPFSLSGTNYTQNFDGLAAGLPQGWRVDTIVNKNGGLGHDAINRFTAAPSAWAASSGRGFKNVASADGLTATSSSTDQANSTDRSLGMRQVSAAGWDDKDSLISSSFCIANTSGLQSFTLSFKLQSLLENYLTGGNTAVRRYADWIVQYGLGSNPTSFTTIATTPAIVTIDSNFSNTTVSVNFGTALDNQAQNVWIRIMPADTTKGINSRPYIGLDDFSLTWTGTAVNNTPQVVSYTPTPAIMNVPIATTNLSINFDKTMTVGTGNVTVNNLTDATSQTIAATSCTASGTTVTIPGVNLLAGKNYAVQYDSTCFLWTTYKCLGLYNNTSWTFSTEPPIIPPMTSLNESFFGCNPPNFGVFQQFSVTGAQTWRCSNFGRNDTDAVYMNGYASGSSQDNEDYLVSGPINVSAMSTPYVHFWSKKRFSGSNTKEFFVSNNFMGNPSTATWTNLNPDLSTLDTTYKFYSNLNLTAYKASNMNLAFKYVSQASGTADEWSIDDVYITDGPVGLLNFEQAGVSAIVLGTVVSNLSLQVRDISTNKYLVSITDIYGKRISEYQIQSIEGKKVFNFNTSSLSNGIYFLTLSSENVKGSVKFIKQ